MIYKFFVVFVSLFLLSTLPVFAQTMAIGESSDSAELSVSPAPEYVLPYPGMLPDNPLYFLKEIRDSIISALISDPVKKAEFNLLQADKSLQNGAALLTKKESSLAFKSFTLEETFFQQAIDEAQKAQKQGRETKDLFSNLSQSAQKHQEVLHDTEKNLSGDDKKKFMTHEEVMDKLTSKVVKITLQ